MNIEQYVQKAVQHLSNTYTEGYDTSLYMSYTSNLVAQAVSYRPPGMNAQSIAQLASDVMNYLGTPDENRSFS